MAHTKAPTSKTVTDALLKCCMQLAKALLQMFPKAIVANPEVIPVGHRIAERLDAVAGKLVVVMGVPWDPPMVPKVEEVVKDMVTKVLEKMLSMAEDELKKDSGIQLGVVKQALQHLKPWWPHGKTIVGAQERLEALRIAVEEPTIQSLNASLGTPAERELMTFASEIDAVFLDLGTELGLLKKMDGEVSAGLARMQMQNLESELAKGDSMSPEVCSDALVALVPLWEKAWSTDALREEQTTKLQAGCEKLQVWALAEAVRLSSAKDDARLEALRKLATVYDRLREQLPIVAAGAIDIPLLQKIANTAADAHLAVIEKQVEKDGAGHLNPAAILQHLAGYQVQSEGATLTDELNARLASVLAAIESRVLEAYGTAFAADDTKRVAGLLNFSERLDKAREPLLTILGDFSEVGLLSKLKEFDLNVIQTAQTALAGKDEPVAGSAMLELLEPVRKVASHEPPPAEQLSLLCDTVEQEVLRSSSKAAADSGAGETHIEALLKVLEHVKTIREKINSDDASAGESTKKLETMVQHAKGAMLNLKQAEEELAKEGGGFNPNALMTSLKALEADWSGVGSVGHEGLTARLDALYVTATNRMVAAMEKAGTADHDKKEAGLLNFGKGFDDVRTSLNVPVGDTESIYKRLCRVSNEAGLGRLEAELTKESGMNPSILLKAVQDLGHLWAEMGEPLECGERLVESFNKIKTRMATSMDEAVAAENKAKIQALLKFVGELDEACVALTGVSDIGKLREELAAKAGE
eukprot:TRINITY_DN32009_c0_g1_i1.p1 TRINITY_DN32009_c0_g1~~TRINITY_DN32009_c0_g1_i1.p1  ORF type:complete len:875 (-),score=244.41 TRINITY_DN32009_c0_g1_i1:68-2335(-)